MSFKKFSTSQTDLSNEKAKAKQNDDKSTAESAKKQDKTAPKQKS